MAFELSSWIKSKFKTGRDAASIRETAEGVLANKDAARAAVGSTRLETWANAALSQLKRATEYAGRKDQNGTDLGAKALSKAGDWISGSAQAHSASRLLTRAGDRKTKVSKKLSNEQSNINILENNLKLATSPESKARFQAQIDKKKAKMSGFDTIAGVLGAKAEVTDIGNGTFIPTANLSRGQRMTAAAERQGLIERAAGIATNVVGGTQATAENVAPPRVATTIDNTVDARAFAEQEPEISVGGTANNAGTSASPVFVGPDGTSLYYIPAGTNQPTKITDPAQLQNLVGSGAVAAGDASTYKPLASANDWLSGQEGAKELGITGADGPRSAMTSEMQTALAPAYQAIYEMEQNILDFERTDYGELREGAEDKLGIDGILDELSTVDKSLADLLNIQDRVPQTTLDAAKGTFVTQSVLDRQRTNILHELAETSAPLSRLKSVLLDDLERREKLIDDAVSTAKESDAFKLQKLGYALDYATTNLGYAQDRAEAILNAAVADYEDRQRSIELAAKDKKESEKEYQKAMISYYEKKGYLVNPETGEIEVKPMKASSGGKTYITPNSVSYITQTMNASKGSDGKTNTALYSDLYQQTAAMSGPKAGEEFLKRFPASTWLNPNDPTATALFGTKPSSSMISSDSDLEASLNALLAEG